MSNATTPPPPPGSPFTGPGSPQDVPPPPGSFPIDPATLPDPIRDELEAPDPVAIDTSAAELKDGLNRCPKCGSTDIRQKPGSDLLVCQYCRHQWHGERVEEEFGLGEGIDQLQGTVVASGARDARYFELAARIAGGLRGAMYAREAGKLDPGNAGWRSLGLGAVK